MAGNPVLPPGAAQAILYPDLAQQQAKLQLAQQYAQALMQDGGQPQGQMLGQIYAPPSWTQQLAQAIKAPLGAYMLKKNMNDQVELNKSIGQRYADVLQQQVPQGSFKDGALMDADTRQLYNQWMAQKMMGDEDTAQKTWQAIMDRQAMTPEQKNNRWSGISPQEQKTITISQAMKNSEIDRKPESQFYNYFTGTSGMVPKIPENVNPVGGIAPNGALPGGVAPIPGALPAAQANAQAGSTGSSNGSIITVTTPEGKNVPMRGSSAVGGSTGVNDSDRLRILQQERSNPKNTAADNAALDREIASLSRHPQLGQSTTDRELQVAGAQKIAALPQIAVQSKQTVAGLENALNTLQQSGPGLKGRVNVEALLQNWGLPVGKSETEKFQTLQKFLNNALATAASATGANGSDARFEQFLHGQPNADTMNAPALDKAIRYVLSQHDAAQVAAKYQLDAYQKARAEGDANAAQTAQQKWAEVYDPRVFEFSRMSPEQRQQFKSSMSKDQQAQFGARYNQAHAMGWVQ